MYSKEISACALVVQATLILRRSPRASRSSITHIGLSGQRSWWLDTSWPSIPLRIPGVRRLYRLLAQPNILWHKKAFILVLQRFTGFSIWFICVTASLPCPLLPKHAWYLSLVISFHSSFAFWLCFCMRHTTTHSTRKNRIH